MSPPVHRLTMSPSVALEYGFPSTHSTNSISVALFLISMACEKLAPESPARLISVIACTFYAVSVVFGRIYCGMHTITGTDTLKQIVGMCAQFLNLISLFRLYWWIHFSLFGLFGPMDF